MLGLIKKIFGTAQSRQLKRYQKHVKQINQFEKDYQKLSDEITAWVDSDFAGAKLVSDSNAGGGTEICQEILEDLR